MPYGGRYQLTETQSMVAKLPVLKGEMRYSNNDGLRLRPISFIMEPIPRIYICSA